MKDSDNGREVQDLSSIEFIDHREEVDNDNDDEDDDDDDDDDDYDEFVRSTNKNTNNNNNSHTTSWSIPLPPRRAGSFRPRTSLTTRTPLLVPTTRRRQQQHVPEISSSGGIDEGDSEIYNADVLSTSLLFGDLTASLSTHTRSVTKGPYRLSNATSSGRMETPEREHSDARPRGVAGWFFGFMYEEVYNDSFDFDDGGRPHDVASTSVWNAMNIALFISYGLASAATSLPILLIPTISQEFISEDSDVPSLASRAASSAAVGIACGKFLNGPLCDVMGARRTSSLYSVLVALALTGLALSRSAASVTALCFLVDFFHSVQWPSMIVILAAHYRPPQHQAMYESGIYLTSIASRFGTLFGIPIFSFLLRQWHWRVVCLIGAWTSLIGSSVMYLFITDSPLKVNDPQNALHPVLLQQVATLHIWKAPKRCLVVATRVVRSIILNNLLPGFHHVLKSGTFWIVALAHTGSSMVRSSERILGTYFHDTSFGYLSDNQGGSLVVFLSLGTMWGLAIAGKLFAQRKERQRKWLVSRLYAITIGACYSLSILAIPAIRRLVDSPDLILFFQITATFVMGFGIAVMSSMIPGLVGSAFGSHKGFYTAYTDGVAYGLSSIVWRIVSNAVQNGSPDGGGWAYGWAAVALLLVLCSILMIEFMEHYFVRPSGRHHGTYETIIFA
jgi:MFS family permease